MAAISGVERVADPVRLAGTQCDHIEAARFVGPARFLLQEQLRGDCQPLAFAPVDALDRATPSLVPAVADLDEYYCIAVEHDQIELAASAAPVAMDQAQAPLLEHAAGKRLGLLAALPRSEERRVGGEWRPRIAA